MASNIFVYCPYCASPLVDREVGGRMRRACSQCSFVQYPDPKVGVVGQVEHDGRILLVRRGINPGKGLWSMPGGFMDAGEEPTAALQRELLEETGLAVAIQELVAIYPMVNHHGPSRGIVLVYRAFPLQPDVEPVADDDVSEVRWFFPCELPTELAFESTQTQLQHWRQHLAS